MKSRELKAHAKVNLSLNVTGTSGGMHLLESVVSAIDLYDELTVEFNRGGETRVRFYSGEVYCCVPEKNSVTEALRFLQRYVPNLGAKIRVKKNIPLAGGLGGSSADAAAVISAALNLLPELADNKQIIADSVSVGSDVPVMTAGGCSVMSGVGEKVVAVKAQKLHLVLACGKGGVSSGAAYNLFDELYPQKIYCPSDTDKLVNALECGSVLAAAPELKNALTKPARMLCESVSSALAAIEETNAAAVFMTGSGNCCCGLYETARAAACAAEKLSAKGLWAKCAVTADKG